MGGKKEWFDTWFDTPYYHTLYKNRDFKEASNFIDVLYRGLKLNTRHKVLDVACGKGRHSIHLNQMGLQVTGIDLSKESITTAKQFENEDLHFYQHDMRKAFKTNAYDCVLNLFTSFGYFEEEKDNQLAIKSMAENLKVNGVLVLDFFNPKYVIDNLVSSEEKVIDGIEFKISKSIEEGFIVKSIEVIDKSEHYCFQERVKAIAKEEFDDWFNLAGLKVKKTYGSYSLQDYNPNSSERMIFIAQK